MPLLRCAGSDEQPPRAGADLEIERLLLVWAPWHVDADGIAEPLHRLEG